MGKTKALTEGAIMLALYMVLFLVTLYVPLIGSLTLFALALPFVVFSSRRGWKSSLVLFGASVILTLLFGSIIAVPITFLYGLSGIVIGYLFKLNRSKLEVLSGGSIAYIINLLVIYIITTAVFQINPIEEAQKAVDQSINMSREMMEALGQSINEEQINLFAETFELVPLLMPTAIVFVGVFLAFITQIISTRILKRLGLKVEKWPPFRSIQLPKSLIWYYLVTMIAMMFPMEQDSMFFLAIFNLFHILQLLMILQGFSFIFYFCYHKNVSKGIPITILILSFLLPPLLYIVRIIGIIDLGFNLRARVESKK
ncbi:YybS family protein [Bacillus pinisoli]|uniref:YybS family protein n=1 Tax=Bacillus pinisoli TaxID=2901866 RepID=UPI001FF2211A|nr:YybS family protein [Bacillus pinisoli]